MNALLASYAADIITEDALQELQRYDPLDVMLQPFAQDELADPAPYRLPESLLFPARSTRYLPRCHDADRAGLPRASIEQLAKRQ